MYRYPATYFRSALPACTAFALAAFLLFPPVSSAQPGLRFEYPNDQTVKFWDNGVYANWLGIDTLETVPLPKSVLQVTRKKEVNTDFNKYIISEEYLGREYKIPLVIDLDQYTTMSRAVALQKEWYQSSTKIINLYGSSKRKGGAAGLNFRIPTPLRSERFNRIVGGEGAIGLRVTGEVNITGNLINNDRSQVKDTFQGSDNTFRLQQTQRFRITGKVGEKISVSVDQNSEADFDLENNIRLSYVGEEDEIFKSIEAGNVSLALPGTQFITFSGVNRGLFGFKTINKIGPLDITSIASLERGEKKSLILKGGAQSATKKIKDYNYLTGVYFFVDTQYRDNYTFDQNGILQFSPADEIVEFELWMSGNNYNTDPEAKEAWAVWDPENIAPEDTLGGGDQNNVKRHFKRLIPNQDYELFKDPGYIIMTRPVRTEVLALAYRTRSSGKVVGDLIPPDELSPPEKRPFILKLLRTTNPVPTDKTWTLEWRNVYSLSSGLQGISREGLDIQIVRNNTIQEEPIQDDGLTFLEIFGLDRKDESGNPVSDGQLDVGNTRLFDFQRGHLILPGRRPFDPVDGKDPYTGQNSKLKPELRTPEIYDQVFLNASDKNSFSKFDIVVIASNQSRTFDLGFNIIPGSEEIFLNGAPLVKGVDYEIDYGFGQLTMLNSAAFQEGAKLEVKYESSEIFQLDKKALFGTNVKYALGDQSFIGGTALFLNERILETRVGVGQEPKKNLVWGVNTSLNHQSNLMSSIIDKLPLLKATAPTTLTLEGEFAQSRPNPNTLNNAASGDPDGVAYLDDFESSKRISSLGIMRRTWRMSSLPILKNPATGEEITLSQNNRVKMMWYNPFKQVSIKEILPERETNSRTQNLVNIMEIGFIKDRFGRFPENPWGGIMQWVGPANFNQTETKYIEMWVRGDQGVIHVDLGFISEDAVPNGKLDTEDGILTDFQNLILEPEEDVGLWHTWNQEHPDEPWDDEWTYFSGSEDYTQINGTAGNGQAGNSDGALIPDTEDLDGEGDLDRRNEYFQFSIDIGNDAVSGEYKVSGPNVNGWKLYRVPLNEFIPIGNPDFAQIQYARLWFTGIPEGELIGIYNVDLVGNVWKELGTAKNDTLVERGQYTANDTLVSVDVVNTEDNASEYVSPEGVAGELDRITGVRSREQSMRIRFTNLKSGYSAAARSVFFRDRNVIHYRRLKMFIYGDPALTPADTTDDSSMLEVYFQIGMDNNNYYEIRKKIFAGWNVKNEINIDLWELPKLKAAAYDSLNTNVITQVRDNGEVWKIVGNPSFQKLKVTTIGVKNVDTFPVTGFIWVDEMRVSEVDRASGTALRASATVNLAGMGTIAANISQRDADFHTLNDQFGTLENTNSLSLFLRGFSVERMFPFLNSFSIPLDYSVNRSNATPKYLRGSDILYSPGDSTSANEEKESVSTSFSTSFSKKPTSKNWFIKNSLEALRLRYSSQKSSSKDVVNEINRSTSTNGQISHTLNFGSLSIRPLFIFDHVWGLRNLGHMRLFLLPKNILTSLSARETVKDLKHRNGELKVSKVLTADRVISSSMSPFSGFSVTFKRSTSNDLSHLKDKSKLFTEMFNDTTITKVTQSVSGSYTPQILKWLSPNLSYTAGYDLATNRQQPGTGKTARSDRTVNAKLSLSLEDLLGKIYKIPESAGPQVPAGRVVPAPRRRGGGETQTPEQTKGKEKNAQEEKEKRKPNLLNPLYYVGKFTSALAPINVSYTRKTTLQNPQLDGFPTLGYQLGFTKDPGVEFIENLGKNTGAETDNAAFNISSSLSPVRKVNISFKFDRSDTETNRQNNLTGTSSMSMFIYNETRLPMPEYGLQISNLETLKYLRSLTNSVNLSHAYVGKRSINWIDTPENETSKRFDWGFQPFARVSINWKKGLVTTFTMNLRNSLNIDDRTGAEKKELSTTMQFSAAYNLSSGFNISLPFGLMGKKHISNSVNFQMAFDKTENSSLEKRAGYDEFLPLRNNTNWSVSPQLTYRFTDKVEGGFNFKWQVTENERTGKNITKDFGLNVRIRIAG